LAHLAAQHPGRGAQPGQQRLAGGRVVAARLVPHEHARRLQIVGHLDARHHRAVDARIA
jgi:hypothetical protein